MRSFKHYVLLWVSYHSSSATTMQVGVYVLDTRQGMRPTLKSWVEPGDEPRYSTADSTSLLV